MPGGTATCVYAGIVELCSPHTKLVSKYGMRFADETFFQGIVPQIRLFDPVRHEYANLPAYLIFDAQYLKKYSFANQPIGSDVPREPPFYGIQLHPAGGSSVGLLTDVRGQVIHQRRHPIAGLYASGNVAAATEHGVGYQAGLSLASSMTFSCLAVRHIIEG